MGEVTNTMTELRRAGKKALVPFITAGFPTRGSFRQLLAEVSRIADVVEIGVPFSDPLADGPVIQHTSQMALEQGVNLPWILETMADCCQQMAAPLVLMSYLNPLLRLTTEDALQAAHRAGVAGMIVPDLPVEEGREFEKLAGDREIDLIYLIAPTTGDARARMIAERSQGFIYLVSITGLTGARDEFPQETFGFLKRVRALTDKPLCLGFGISRPEQVRQIAPHVDGVIVGSSLLRVIMKNPSDPINAAKGFLLQFKQALEEVES
ncbi:MAG: tryptophan synthase subunit alpha [Acidobacteria bacterium]|nr:tryptophan synthase subunit alpha [Acidobacteriota bacterium]